MTRAFVLLGFALMYVISLVVCIIFEPVERIRRNKYPEYFKLLDAGNKLREEAAYYTKKEVAYLEFKFKLLTDGLRDGECTEEYFRERFNELADHHTEVIRLFTAAQAEAEKLLREADLYAKENNLLWGVLY